MHFMVYARDKDNALDIRTSNRDAHLAWLKTPANVSVCVAGPWLDTDGVMRGSLLIVEAESTDTVTAWLSHDPYKAAGLTDSVTVHPYIWAIGKP